MHLTAALPALLSLLAATAAGDRMEVTTECKATHCDSDYSVFFVSNTNETWAVNANSNCRRTKVPMMSLCVDWNNRRAHFWFDDKPGKRCLIAEHSEYYLGCAVDRCEKSWWNEVDCYW